DAAAAGAGVVIDGAVVEGQARGDAEDAAAAAARRRHRVPAHLTLIERGGCAEAVSDPTARVRGVAMGHDGAVESDRSGEVHDAATGAGRDYPRYVPAGDGDSVEGERPARSAVDRDDPEVCFVTRDRCVLAVDRDWRDDDRQAVAAHHRVVPRRQ